MMYTSYKKLHEKEFKMNGQEYNLDQNQMLRPKPS